MYAPVLHAIGSAPRYEEFSEPLVSDNGGEAIVHVHGASLKPIDKQLAGGSHYASPRELPACAARMGSGISATDNGSSSADLDHPTVRWHSVRSCHAR
jgi:hypothetical protein